MMASLSEQFEAKLNNFKNMSRQEIRRWRGKRLRLINEEEMVRIYHWPKYVRTVFLKRTEIGDTDTFLLLLFFLGNGYCPYRAGSWILSSYFQCGNPDVTRAQKRIRQFVWIVTNLPRNRSKWRYFDLQRRTIQYFEGRVYVPNAE